MERGMNATAVTNDWSFSLKIPKNVRGSSLPVSAEHSWGKSSLSRP